MTSLDSPARRRRSQGQAAAESMGGRVRSGGGGGRGQLFTCGADCGRQRRAGCSAHGAAGWCRCGLVRAVSPCCRASSVGRGCGVCRARVRCLLRRQRPAWSCEAAPGWTEEPNSTVLCRQCGLLMRRLLLAASRSVYRQESTSARAGGRSRLRCRVSRRQPRRH